ncbi:AAA-type ATPase lid domain-containing protein, partial [Cumulibacter manganitolerans]|uniref:helix-turn-helix domain-containing protein n=1 Tax=Cumulibacter manganitolerans TaxID=1884992 RepID=UPI002B1EE65C
GWRDTARARFAGAHDSPHADPAERAGVPNGGHTALGVTGRSPAAARLREAMLRASGLGRPVLVTGEEGAGRRRLAGTLLARWSPQRPVVIDGTAPEWLRRLDAAVDAGAPVLVTDLIASDPVPLRAAVARAHRQQVPLVATAVDAGRLAGVFPFGIAVPPLRERRADVRDLTAELIAKLAPGRSLAAHPRALLTLEAHAWPGNVRELQYVLSLAIQECIGEELLERHLPLSGTARDHGLTPIERAERDAIVTALTELGGNKVAAAAALGFARSTLYRKMRALRIDDRAPF